MEYMGDSHWWEVDCCMEIEYRKANIEDAELLIGIYNVAFYSDYIKYGECPGYVTL